jgi:hypothetical protein
MPIPFLAAMADHDGIRQIQRLDGPWEFRQPDGSIIDLTDEDLRFLIALAPAIETILDRVSATPQARSATPSSHPAATQSATQSVGQSAGPATPRSPGADPAPLRPAASQAAAPAARSGKPWTDQEDARLIASLQSGVTIPKIADAFGRTPGAIVARCLLLDVISVSFKTAPINAPETETAADAAADTAAEPGPGPAQDMNGA